MQQYGAMTATMDLKTRKQAMEAGEKFYWTGKPCKHGHSSVRFTSVGQCAMCQRNQTNTFRADQRKAIQSGKLTHISIECPADMAHEVRLALREVLNPIQQYRAALNPEIAHLLTIIDEHGCDVPLGEKPKKRGGLSPFARRGVIPDMPEGLTAEERLTRIAVANGRVFQPDYIQGDGEATRRMENMMAREIAAGKPK